MSTTALLLGLAAAGCSSPSPATLTQEPAATAKPTATTEPQFIPVSFEELYPVFLKHRANAGVKGALWTQRYRGRWVRWTGELVSFTDNGVTFRQLLQTVTFDVSLWIDPASRPRLRRTLKRGAFYTYIGQLDSYDDIFRTLYLVRGAVIPVPVRDAGLSNVPIPKLP